MRLPIIRTTEIRCWAAIAMTFGAVAIFIPTTPVLAQQGGAGAAVRDELFFEPDNPLGFACSQGLVGLDSYSVSIALSAVPGRVAVGPCAYTGGVGHASASWDFGRLVASASVAGGYGGDGHCCENAFAFAEGIFEDALSFGAGVIPTDVVFYYALRSQVSRANEFTEFLAILGADFNNRVYVNSPGIGSATFHTSGSIFSFFGYAGLSLSTSYIDPADFAIRGTTAFRVTGLQFFSNGVNVTSQVTPTFASGHHYRIGAPQVAVVPEPQTVALLATGLLGIGAVGWQRRRQPK